MLPRLPASQAGVSVDVMGVEFPETACCTQANDSCRDAAGVRLEARRMAGFFMRDGDVQWSSRPFC
jgi:hypothetical protein